MRMDQDKVNDSIRLINKWVAEGIEFRRVLNDVAEAKQLTNDEVSFIKYIMQRRG